jgi:hypothetical protein
VFTLAGVNLGIFATVTDVTGLAFGPDMNLYLASDLGGAYAIYKVAPDGTVSLFTSNGVKTPHGMVFDDAGNLFVTQTSESTVRYFAPDGTSTVYADASDGLSHPVDLIFDATGNLFVTNNTGGPTGTGSVIKFTPEGEASVFADSGFSKAYGIAIDSAGNIYVSNYGGNTIEKFAPDGTDLGVFISTHINGPHGMIFDGDGNLYVASNLTCNIQKFAPDGTYLGVLANTGVGPHFLVLSNQLPPPQPTPTPTPPPVITVQPVSVTKTLGQTAKFTVTATGAPPLRYQWKKNGTDIAGAVKAAYTTPPVTNDDNGSLFCVAVANQGGTVTSDNATLTIKLPPVITTQPADTTVTVGQKATFTVVAGGIGPFQYQWRKNGTNITGATRASYTTPATTSADNGSLFSVIVSNNAGSITSRDALLTVN